MQANDIHLITDSADIVLKYGFLGVGLVLTLVVAPFVYGLWKSRAWTGMAVGFGLAFIIAWGGFDIVRQYFPNWLASSRVLLSGIILDVPNGFQVQISSDVRNAGSAYIKRENDLLNRELNKFSFLLVARQAPSCLAVAITNNNPTSEGGSGVFKVAPIVARDLNSNVSVVARARRPDNKFHLRVWREIDDRTTGTILEVQPLGDAAAGCSFDEVQSVSAEPPVRGFLDWLWPSAFAQSNSPAAMSDFSARLKSDDLVTRRNARIDLSKQGRVTVETANALLSSDDYRLQLGALVALSLLPAQERQSLPPELMAKVRQFTTNSDATIAETARKIAPP